MILRSRDKTPSKEDAHSLMVRRGVFWNTGFLEQHVLANCQVGSIKKQIGTHLLLGLNDSRLVPNNGLICARSLDIIQSRLNQSYTCCKYTTPLAIEARPRSATYHRYLAPPTIHVLYFLVCLITWNLGVRDENTGLPRR